MVVGFLVDFPGEIFRDALGDDGDSADLRKVHGLDGGFVGGAQRGEIDQDVRLGMLLHAVGHVLIDGDQDFLRVREGSELGMENRKVLKQV